VLRQKAGLTHFAGALHTLQLMWSVRKLGLPSFLTEGDQRTSRARLGRSVAEAEQGVLDDFGHRRVDPILTAGHFRRRLLEAHSLYQRLDQG
jgi:hypothetical protein